MIRLIALVLSASTALANGAAAVSLPDSLHDAATQTADSLDLAQVALLIAREVDPNVDIDAYRGRLDAMADELRTRLKPDTDLETTLQIFAQFIYQDMGFADRRLLPPDIYVGLPSVLDKQQWNCVSLSLLYVALGQKLQIPLKMVAGRGHVFVEYDGSDKTLFVETTDHGRIHDKKNYIEEYLPFPCLRIEDYLPLEPKEAVSMLLVQTAAAVQSANPQKATELFDAALEFNPNDPDAYAGKAFILQMSGKPDLSVPLFREAIALNPRHIDAYGGLGLALHAKGDLKGAIDAYREAIKICAEDAKALYNLAQLLYEAGALKEAIESYNAYIRIEPDNPEGYLAIAFPLEDSGDLEGAEKAYRRAIELEPRRPDAFANLGLVLKKKGEIDDAIEAYEQSLRIRPNFDLAHAGLGDLYRDAARWPEAVASYEQAARLMPGDAAILIDLADAYLHAGARDQAKAAFDRAVAVDPAAAQDHADLAAALTEAPSSQ